MTHSDSITKLAAALLAATKEIDNPKNTTKNAFLGNGYLPLPDLIELVKPVLSQHGLMIVQMPVSEDGKVGITTTILHESGEWMSESVSMTIEQRKGVSLAQVAGGTITYLRRYAMSAALNIASEDDDGNHGTNPTEPPQEPKGEHVDYSRMDPDDMKPADLGKAIKQESTNLAGHEDYVEQAEQSYKEKNKAGMAALLKEIRAKRDGAANEEELF